MGKGQILANPGIGTHGTSGTVEHADRRLRLAGKRQCKAEIGRIEHGASFVQYVDRRVALALRDGHQRQLEHQLRLVGHQRQRVAIGALGRGEAPAGEIGIAQQGAETGVARRIADRAFGQADRCGIITLFDRHLRPGGNADVGTIDLVAEDRGPVVRANAGRGTGAKRADHADSGQGGSKTQRLNHHDFPSNCGPA